MKGIEIEVAWHTEESAKLEKLGIESVLIINCQKRRITLYNIDHIKPFQDDDDNWYCSIASGGELFTAFKTYDQIKKLIEGQSNENNHNRNHGTNTVLVPTITKIRKQNRISSPPFIPSKRKRRSLLQLGNRGNNQNPMDRCRRCDRNH